MLEAQENNSGFRLTTAVEIQHSVLVVDGGLSSVSQLIRGCCFPGQDPTGFDDAVASKGLPDFSIIETFPQGVVLDEGTDLFGLSPLKQCALVGRELLELNFCTAHLLGQVEDGIALKHLLLAMTCQVDVRLNRKHFLSSHESCP